MTGAHITLIKARREIPIDVEVEEASEVAPKRNPVISVMGYAILFVLVCVGASFFVAVKLA